MEHVQHVINEAVLKVAKQKSAEISQIDSENCLVADLGFESLDIAQLVALLEMEFEFDPFANGSSIAEIKTVTDLYNVYARHIN